MYSVLIVDDEKEIREELALRFQWAKLGITSVYTASDGVEALAKAEELSPDLIVTDIKMSRMTGLAMIDALKDRNYAGKSIVVSGYDEFDLVKQAMQLGASVYLLKPVNTDELAQAVTKVLDQLRAEKLNA
jgi:two-component system response regulator YesN